MGNPIVFRRNIDIGAADAESDDAYLEHCFVDTGDLSTLLDCSNPKSLVLGRTGAGKTALLKQVTRSAENSVELSPEALSLNFVSNSQTIQFFEAAGVNLDAFYTLLWRHILTVELLKLRYSITNQSKQNEFLDRMKQIFMRDKAKEKALNYLTEWGNRFWEETEYRTKEFTRKLETDLKAGAKLDAKYLNLGVDGAQKLSEEEKLEVRTHGMRVVNQVQVKELHDVIGLLSEDIFTDQQKKYYIIIDRLDEGWVADDRIRFRLIKALIEAVKTFHRIQTVKIVVALRNDLYHQVLKETLSAGFQEEKYKSLYLQLRWTRNQLIKLLDDRVSYMFKRQYTNSNVKLVDILPTNQIDQRSPVDYIVDRTFFRPREAIIYLNECIAKAEGTSRITIQLLKQAELSYSQQRLVSLGDEWRRDYPNLLKAITILNHRTTPFSIEDISRTEADDLATKILENCKEADPISKTAERYFLAGTLTQAGFVEELVSIFYHTGVIGIKPEPHLPRQWSYIDQPFLGDGQVKPTSLLDIHKTFWAALGATRKGARETKHDRHIRSH